MDAKDKKNISKMIDNLNKIRKEVGWKETEKIDKIIKEQIEILSMESATEVELFRDMNKYNV